MKHIRYFTLTLLAITNVSMRSAVSVADLENSLNNALRQKTDAQQALAIQNVIAHWDPTIHPRFLSQLYKASKGLEPRLQEEVNSAIARRETAALRKPEQLEIKENKSRAEEKEKKSLKEERQTKRPAAISKPVSAPEAKNRAEALRYVCDAMKCKPEDIGAAYDDFLQAAWDPEARAYNVPLLLDLIKEAQK